MLARNDDAKALWGPKLARLALPVLIIAAFLAAHSSGLVQEAISISILSVDDTAFPEVHVVFTADQRGRPINEVRLSEVRIEESGLAATPVAIRRATDSNIPLALVITLDVSGSMVGETLTKAQAAAIGLSNNLVPADAAAVVSFADEVRVEQTLSSDKAALTGAISRLRAGGNTALYDAVAESARIAADTGFPRRAVVLLSDGQDFGSRSKLNREQSLAVASDAASLFYVVGVGPEIDRASLEELATRSKGRFFQAAGASEVPAVYASLEELLRSQFVITFRASSPADRQTAPLRSHSRRVPRWEAQNGPIAAAGRLLPHRHLPLLPLSRRRK